MSDAGEGERGVGPVVDDAIARTADDKVLPQ
jgi:hypothetical protein